MELGVFRLRHEIWMNRAEYNAVLAGLRLLQRWLPEGDDPDINAILCDGEYDPIGVEEIDALCERLNVVEVG